LIYQAANPLKKGFSYWIISAFIIVTILVHISAAFFFSYATAGSLWYAEPSQFNLNLARHYARLENKSGQITRILLGVGCLESVGLLCGTIYWVRKITQKGSQPNQKTSSLNLRMVFGHIFILFIETFTVLLMASDLKKTMKKSTNLSLQWMSPIA
jgi:hypothetical protein